MHAKNHDYEDKLKDASGTALVGKLKKAIASLKEDLKKQKLDEGIMNSILFSCAAMRRGQHHLYDEIASPVQAATSGASGTNKNNTEAA